jgi:hypothetical protein
MTGRELVALVVVPGIGVAIAWGLAFYARWQARRDDRHTPAE